MESLESTISKYISHQIDVKVGPLQSQVELLKIICTSVLKLQNYPDLMSGNQVQEALSIGPEKFKKLLLLGLDDKAGEGNRPAYWKPQLVEIIETNKSLFS